MRNNDIEDDFSFQLDCPKCGSINSANILYGFVDSNDEELAKQIELGKTVLGGSEIDEDSPQSYCNDCGHSW